MEIEPYVMIGQNVRLVGSGHNYGSLELPYIPQGGTAKGIRIGRNTWIGGGSIVLDGVTIGRNCIVGAGSIVDTSIPDNTMHVDRNPREFRVRHFRLPEGWPN